MILYRAIVLSLPFLFAVSCKNESTSGSAGQRTGSTGSKEATVVGSSLVGKWKKDCRKEDDSASLTKAASELTSYKVTASFSDSGFEIVNEYFADGTCTKKETSSRLVGTYKVGGVVNQLPDAAEIDFVSVKGFTTYFISSLVDGANKSGLCGGGWQVGRERAQDPAACGADFGPKNSYLIYRVKDGTLFFGDTGEVDGPQDGSTVRRRPTSLESEGFTRS